ncbi:MAG: hypothetical protein PHT48_10030 [Dechloromonas sp.]|nr:hypothetical protein [Dechloromonas sp.]
MPSPILARADALMHRRRASPGEGDELPLLTEALPEQLPDLQQAMAEPAKADEHDDIPVLHDVESPLDAAAAIPVASHATPGGLLAQLNAALDRELPSPTKVTNQASPAAASRPTPQPAPPTPAPSLAPVSSPSPARQRAELSRTRVAPDLPALALQELSQRLEQRLTALLPALIAETLDDYLQELAERNGQNARDAH